jgi:hypothetical protein
VLSLFLINLFFYMIHWVYFALTSPSPLLLFQKTLITIVYNTVISCVVILLISLFNKLKIVMYD